MCYHAMPAANCFAAFMLFFSPLLSCAKTQHIAAKVTAKC